MAESKPKYPRELTQHLEQIYLTSELPVAQSNTADDNRVFEDALNLIDLDTSGGDYDWHSDLSLPEYLAMFLTQASLDAAQLSTTRDYSEVYLQDGSEEAKAKAAAAKECINRTLNQRHLYFFIKYLRAQGIRRLSPRGVTWRCWWERKDHPVVTGWKKNMVVDDTVDVNGMPMMDRSIQVPGMKEMMEPVVEDEPVVDRWNADVLDPRNVWMSPEYAYTIQDKKYVYVRYERTKDQLEAEQDDYGYFNLDLLGRPPDKTDTAAETEKDAKETVPVSVSPDVSFDIIERYGKCWVKVTERDEVTGEPLKAEPGYDEFGKKSDKAELQECIMAWAKSGSVSTLIRFQLTPYVDTTGVPFRPLVRGLCYIHPTKDGGFGDERSAIPLQAAINDNFNMSNDRVRLATFPVIKVNKYDAEDNDTLYDFRPGHRMEMTDVKNAEEFRIRDDINGSLAQGQMLSGSLRRSMAVYPSTQGETPAIASTTATAIADAGAHANTRASYQQLTAEHTMLTELYWMILQMTGKFAHPKTGKKLMGDKVYDFDPNADYIYKPITQAIEPESSKFQKRKDYATMFGYAAQVPNPNTPKVLNKLLQGFFETFGDEYEDMAGAFFDEAAPMQPPTGGGMSPNPEAPVSNQNMLPMTGGEMSARAMASGFQRRY